MSQASTSRRPRFAISLRIVLLGFMLLPPAGWFWWRLPFEQEFVIEEEPQRPVRRNLVTTADGREHLVQPFLVLGPPKAGPFMDSYTDARLRKIGYYCREVRTVRRVGWEDTQRHGPTKAFNKAGRLITEEHWKDGVLDGPYRHWDEKGTLRFEGQFVKGRRHGAWKQWDENGEIAQEYYFEQDRPAGVWVKQLGSGTLETEHADGIVRERRQTYVRGGRTDLVIVQRYDDRGERNLLLQLKHQPNGSTTETVRTEFRSGKRHGRVIRRNPTGVTTMLGQWDDDTAIGKWTWFDDLGNEKQVVEFEDGAPTRIDGREVIDGMRFCSASEHDWRGKRLITALSESTSVRFENTPLAIACSYFSDLHNIPIHINKRALEGRADTLTLTGDLMEIPLSMALTILLSKHDLSFAYRRESLFITTLDDAKSWRDRSGLAELTTPQLLANALSDDTTLPFLETPLNEVVDYLANLHGVKFRLSPSLAEDPPKVTISARGLTLQSGLGIICDQYDLKCRVEEDVLVIEKHSP